MSGIFGGKASGGNPTGKGGVDQVVDVPPFTSSGGITPEQQTLANYSLGQDLLAQGNLYGNEGIGDSTMATQGAGGARNTAAQLTNRMSDVNQGAQYSLYENDINALQTQLQNDAVLNQAGNANASTSLSNLTKLAGFFSNPSGRTIGQ